MRPKRAAKRTSSAIECTLSFSKMCERCVSAVRGLMNS